MHACSARELTLGPNSLRTITAVFPLTGTSNVVKPFVIRCVTVVNGDAGNINPASHAGESFTVPSSAVYSFRLSRIGLPLFATNA